MDAHVLRERQRGPVLGHQAQRAEGALQPRRRGGDDDVGDAGEPSGATADGGAVQREDEHLFVVDHAAEEFGGWRGRV